MAQVAIFELNIILRRTIELTISIKSAKCTIKSKKIVKCSPRGAI